MYDNCWSSSSNQQLFQSVVWALCIKHNDYDYWIEKFMSKNQTWLSKVQCVKLGTNFQILGQLNSLKSSSIQMRNRFGYLPNLHEKILTIGRNSASIDFQFWSHIVNDNCSSTFKLPKIDHVFWRMTNSYRKVLCANFLFLILILHWCWMLNNITAQNGHISSCIGPE